MSPIPLSGMPTFDDAVDEEDGKRNSLKKENIAFFFKLYKLDWIFKRNFFISDVFIGGNRNKGKRLLIS